MKKTPCQLYVCRASIEKIYGWKEKDKASQGVLMGLLELWGECPEDRSKGYIRRDELSPAGKDAYKDLCYYRSRGWV